MKKKTLINWLGLLGMAGFLSYTAAVIFSPSAYPGYDWMSRAVSDLSAMNAPSLGLWNRLNAFGICSMICVTLVCVYIQGKLSRSLRTGIYLFAIMQWVTAVGYKMFPLTTSEYTETASGLSDAMTTMSTNYQDAMHMAVTVLVVVLSVVSLVLIMLGGYGKKKYISLAVWAAAALVLMMIGGIGAGIVPKEIFGVIQRFSNFSAMSFNAVLGIYLFYGFSGYRK